MFRLAFIIGLSSVAACVVPANTPPAQPAAPAAPPQPVNGAGTWATTWVWGHGSCGLMGNLQNTLSVTQNAAGYMIQENDPNISVQGSLNCDFDACKLLVSESQMLNGAPANVSVNFTLTPDGMIKGGGNVSLTQPQCTQQFSASGRRT